MLTITFMHMVNLGRIVPATLLDTVVIELVPFRCRGQFGTRESGKGMEEQIVDGKKYCVTDTGYSYAG